MTLHFNIEDPHSQVPTSVQTWGCLLGDAGIYQLADWPSLLPHIDLEILGQGPRDEKSVQCSQDFCPC